MKERAILFSAPMVRAILASMKAQTRRVMKNPPVWSTDHHPAGWFWNGKHPGEPALSKWPDAGSIGREIAQRAVCPYGQPGDRLVVRETFYAFGRWVTQFNAKKGRDEWHFVDMTLESGKAYLYPANDSQPQPMGGKRHKGGVTPTWWKRPAIFMPAAASRITLEVTGVRVERLQDISEADAIAEGIETNAAWPGGFYRNYELPEDGDVRALRPVQSYQTLWESINGPESWAANPWVWCVEFKRLEQST